MTATGRRPLVASIALLAVLPLLAGCGTPEPAPTQLVLEAESTDGANGIEKLAIDKVLTRVISATTKAGAVHLTGSYGQPLPVDDNGNPIGDPATPPSTITIDLSGTPTHFRAELASGDITASVIRDGNDVYVTGSQPLADQLGESQVSAGWVRFDAEAAALEPWLALTDVPAIVASVLDPDLAGISFATGSTTQVPVPAVQLEISVQNSLTGTMTVATTGLPVPLALAVTDRTGTGDFTFANWGDEVEVEVPDDATDAVGG